MPGKVLLTDDYLFRMIVAGLQTLAKIIGLKTAGRFQEAQELIDQTLESLFGMRVDLIKRLDDETLFASLKIQDKPDADRIALAARLFQEEGDILTAKGDHAGGYWSFIRALNFALEASLSGKKDDPEINKSITYLIASLDADELPPDTAYAFFCFQEERGNYKNAENVLVDLEKSLDDKGPVLDELVAYYNRLLEKSDAELLKGGLSRLQVVQALNTVLLHKP
jgi:hypothetical protein